MWSSKVNGSLQLDSLLMNVQPFADFGARTR